MKLIRFFGALLLFSFFGCACSHSRPLKGASAGSPLSLQEKGEVPIDGLSAIVIGYSEYTGEWANLPAVNKDVERVSRTLRSVGYDVSEQLNPPSIRFKQSVERRFLTAEPDDSLILYFSGHGAIPKVNGRRQPYLVGGSASHSRKFNQFSINSFAFSDLLNLCQKTRAKQVLIMLDCCFSGDIQNHEFHGRGAEENEASRGIKSRVFIARGGAEKVPASDSFSAAFEKSIRGALAEDRGRVSAEQVFKRLSVNVSRIRGEKRPRMIRFKDLFFSDHFIFDLNEYQTSSISVNSNQDFTLKTHEDSIEHRGFAARTNVFNKIPVGTQKLSFYSNITSQKISSTIDISHSLQPSLKLNFDPPGSGCHGTYIPEGKNDGILTYLKVRAHVDYHLQGPAFTNTFEKIPANDSPAIFEGGHWELMEIPVVVRDGYTEIEVSDQRYSWKQTRVTVEQIASVSAGDFGGSYIVVDTLDPQPLQIKKVYIEPEVRIFSRLVLKPQSTELSTYNFQGDQKHDLVQVRRLVTDSILTPKLIPPQFEQKEYSKRLPSKRVPILCEDEMSEEYFSALEKALSNFNGKNFLLRSKQLSPWAPKTKKELLQRAFLEFCYQTGLPPVPHSIAGLRLLKLK